jgi:hypothetical protein
MAELIIGAVGLVALESTVSLLVVGLEGESEAC